MRLDISAALASTIRLETSTPEGHSGLQSLQWMQRSAWALSSSLPQNRGSTAPVATCAEQVRLARGEAASIRDDAEAGAHPQRRLGAPADPAAMAGRGHLEHLQIGPHQGGLDGRDARDRGRDRSEAVGLVRRMTARGRARLRSRRAVDGRRLPIRRSASWSIGSRPAGPSRRSRVIRCGSSPITLPGLSCPIGSNASLISRKTWISSPNCRRTNCVRTRPQAWEAGDRAALLQDDVVDPGAQRLQPLAVRRHAPGPGMAGGAGGPRRHGRPWSR